MPICSLIRYIHLIRKYVSIGRQVKTKTVAAQVAAVADMIPLGVLFARRLDMEGGVRCNKNSDRKCGGWAVI